MPTSGTCRRTEPGTQPGGRMPRGFTLLEVIVVLAIMGLVAAVATPAVVRGIDSWRRQAQADALMDQLRGLPARARAAGRPIEVSAAALADASPPLRVEDGWTLVVPEPWWVQSNGVCQGGRVELHQDDRVLVLQATAPFCDPRVADAP